MNKDLLHEVIRVEAEIQKSIESERKKAADWLESFRLSLSRELEVMKQEQEKKFTRSLENATREFEATAKKEIADVNAMAEYLRNVPQKVLHEVLQKYLPQILPTGQR